MTNRDDQLVADLGCWVKVQEDGTDEEEVYYLAQNTNVLENRLAPDNAMGTALIGARPGDEVTVHGPSGPIKFSVLDVGTENAQ